MESSYWQSTATRQPVRLRAQRMPHPLKDNIPIPFVIKSNIELLDHGGKRVADVGGQRAR